MTLQQLRYAVKIAEEKSMNKAAAALFVSQPALSATIRDLEEEIGIEIFTRSNRGILITPEGEGFLSYARQMVELSQTVEDHYIHHRVAKQKFSVSMQHYSFAVEAFITLVRELEADEAEPAVRGKETGGAEKSGEDSVQKTEHAVQETGGAEKPYEEKSSMRMEFQCHLVK